jgi:predicted small integral membrane protein
VIFLVTGPIDTYPRVRNPTMATYSTTSATSASAADLGANLVTLAGIGLVGYGLMFLVRNFTGFIELGLTPEHVGGTPEQIQAFSPRLYNYISHLQVAVAGFIIALGVAVIALAWRGIRTGQRWALWTAFLTPVIGVGLALPLHYVYGIGTFGHLGLIYLDAGILLIGTILAGRALAR